MAVSANVQSRCICSMQYRLEHLQQHATICSAKCLVLCIFCSSLPDAFLSLEWFHLSASFPCAAVISRANFQMALGVKPFEESSMLQNLRLLSIHNSTHRWERTKTCKILLMQLTLQCYQLCSCAA